MVQVDNEYGSYGCDQTYKRWLRDETIRHVGDKTVLFTADGPAQVKCGSVENVLATANFGRGSAASIDNNWKILRNHLKNGPLVNSEYYPGWLTHWGEKMARADAKQVVDSFK